MRSLSADSVWACLGPLPSVFGVYSYDSGACVFLPDLGRDLWGRCRVRPALTVRAGLSAICTERCSGSPVKLPTSKSREEVLCHRGDGEA